MIDARNISNGEYFRSYMKEEGWEKPKKAEFRYVSAGTSSYNLFLKAILPVNSIKRGEYRPSLFFSLVAKSGTRNPDIFPDGTKEKNVWSWDQFEIIGEGPRSAKQVRLIDGDVPWIDDLISISRLFREKAREFSSETLAEIIIDNDEMLPDGRVVGLIADLVNLNKDSLANVLALKTWRSLESALSASENKVADAKNQSIIYGKMLSYFDLEV